MDKAIELIREILNDVEINAEFGNSLVIASRYFFWKDVICALIIMTGIIIGIKILLPIMKRELREGD